METFEIIIGAVRHKFMLADFEVVLTGIFSAVTGQRLPLSEVNDLAWIAAREYFNAVRHHVIYQYSNGHETGSIPEDLGNRVATWEDESSFGGGYFRCWIYQDGTIERIWMPDVGYISSIREFLREEVVCTSSGK